MKKFLLVIGLPFIFCQLTAQNVNEDVLKLQKSNASLKVQLKQQNDMLAKQTHTSDSIISSLQSTNAELKKNAEHQQAISKSFSELKTHFTGINKVTTDISNAFGKRKLYALLGGGGLLLLIILLFLLVRKKVMAFKVEVKQNEEKMEREISQLNEFVDKELGEVKNFLEKHSMDMHLAIERQSVENKSMLEKFSTESKDRLLKLNTDVNKSMETQMQSVNGYIKEQFSKSTNEFNEKIANLSNTVDKKIAAIGK